MFGRLSLLFFSVVSMLFFVGCSEGDSSPLVLILGSGQYNQEVNSGEYLFFDIDMRTTSSLATLKVSSKSVSLGREELLAMELDGTSHQKVEFDYLAPMVVSGEYADVELVFRVTNTAGESQSISAKVRVISSSSLLEEVSGQTLYGASSGKANGYSFARGQWLYVETPDASSSIYPTAEDGSVDDKEVLADFYDYSAAPDSETLSLEWRSQSGYYFAKLTGFDYGGATAESVSVAYGVAQKRDRVNNLSVDDVVFVGEDATTPIAAIKINAIYDDAGCNNDRYIISFKRMTPAQVD